MNHLLEERKRRDREMVSIGMQIGEQFQIDIMQVALNEVFGFGYDRIKKLMQEEEKLGAYYSDALRVCMEQDVKQAQLDRSLLRIVKGRQEFYDFQRRYPAIKIADIHKPLRRT